jgi:hypothetical protein
LRHRRRLFRLLSAAATATIDCWMRVGGASAIADCWLLCCRTFLFRRRNTYTFYVENLVDWRRIYLSQFSEF